MRTTSTIIAAKSAMRLSQLAGRGGAALPGLVSEKLDPDLGRKLAAQLPHGVILVTGTNGKTTATKLLVAALEGSGEKVLTNRTGSNLRRGVLSSLIAAGNWRGRSTASIGIFEVDEAAMRQVVPLVEPRMIVVLNLFRDQLDRYGELDTTASIIGEAIKVAPQAKLVLNADDPLVASLAKYTDKDRVSYFGIEGLPAAKASADRGAADSDRCPLCSTPLGFSRVFYAHIGHYKCPKGDFVRPQPQVVMTHLQHSDITKSQFEVSLGGKRYLGELSLPGVYNLYNGLAMLCAGRELDIEPTTLLRALKSTEAAFGRVEKIALEDKTLYLLLIKNPTGFAQIMETFLLKEDKAQILFAINDNYADGRDVSWLWDVPLEKLAPLHPFVVTTGLRAADMSLRLKYAEVASVIENDLEKAFDKIVTQTPSEGIIYLVPTYTAMLGLRKIMVKRGLVEGVKV